MNDPVIKNFKDHELSPVLEDCGYHSPEFSEDDAIVVRNLKWRSSTVSDFIENVLMFYIKLAYANSLFLKKKLRRLLFYVDLNTKKTSTKKRERIYNKNESIEDPLPSDAPDWVKSGYDGPLRSQTAKIVDKYM